MAGELVYALVARDKTVLAEHTSSAGNFVTIVRVLLSRLPRQHKRMSYLYDEFVFHCILRGDLIYLVMSGKELGFAIPFGFLEDLAQRFEEMYGQGQSTSDAIALGMNESFRPIIEQLMRDWNNSTSVVGAAMTGMEGPGASSSFPSSSSSSAIGGGRNANFPQMLKVRSQIDDIQNVMIENIDRLLQRGEKIELLVHRTEQLNQEAVDFRRQAGSLKRAMLWKTIKYAVCGGAVLLLIIAVSVFFRCGSFDLRTCGAASQHNSGANSHSTNNSSSINSNSSHNSTTGSHSSSSKSNNDNNTNHSNRESTLFATTLPTLPTTTTTTTLPTTTTAGRKRFRRKRESLLWQERESVEMRVATLRIPFFHLLAYLKGWQA